MYPSLTLNITEKNGCKKFTMEDTVGPYNSTTNPYGWGAPNIDVGDPSTVTLSVLTPSASTAVDVDISSGLPNTTGTEFTILNTDIGLGSTTKLEDGIYSFTYTVSGTFAITAVSTGTPSFSINGDRTGYFTAGVKFDVDSSTSNDGTYTVVSSTYTGGKTVITVGSSIANATADGTISFSLSTTKKVLFTCQAWECVDTKLALVDIDDCDCVVDNAKLPLLIETFIRAAQYAARCGKANKATKIMNYVTRLCTQTGCTNCN